MNEVSYAGFWRRLLAVVVDSIIIAVVITPLIVMVLGDIDITQYNLSEPDDLRKFLSSFSLRLGVDLMVVGTLSVLFWIFRSATPGKMLLNCSIVDAGTLGPASPSQNIIRYLSYYPGLIALGMGFIWVAFDQRKQGWHDKWAGTVVILGRPHTLADDA